MNIVLLPVSSLDHNTSRGGHLQVLCLGHVHHCSYDMGPAFSTTQYFLVFNLLVFKSCWYKYPFSVRVLFVDSLLSSSSATFTQSLDLASLEVDMTSLSVNNCYCDWPPVTYDEKSGKQIKRRAKLVYSQVRQMYSTCHSLV